jgi:hypothetical protein
VSAPLSLTHNGASTIHAVNDGTDPAVLGDQQGTSSYGVLGRASAVSSIGVYGEQNAGSGTTTGVLGSVASPNGWGVQADNGSAPGAGTGGGLRGYTLQSNGAGVWGENNSAAGGAGVVAKGVQLGLSATASSGPGVYAWGSDLALDADGALNLRGRAGMALPTFGQGRIYFDSGSNKFRVSEDGSSWQDLVAPIGDFVFRSGDTMTGTLNLPANGLSVGTAQLSAVGGNIGIGTSTPSAPLEVRYSGATLNGIRVQGESAGSIPALRLFDTAGAEGGRVAYSNASGSMMVGTSNTGPLTFQTNFTEHMRLNGAGNLGLGTTSPATQLDMTGMITMRAFGSPSLSPFGQGRIYFDSTANRFRVSENNGAFVDLVGSVSAPLGLTSTTTSSAIYALNTNAGAGHALQAQSSGVGSAALWATGATFGVRASGNTGVYGTGATVGVSGETSQSGGLAGSFINTAVAGDPVALRARSTDSGSGIAVQAQASGVGVSATATAANGVGVYASGQVAVHADGPLHMRPLGTAPTGPAGLGALYYDGGTGEFRAWNGTAWGPLGGSVSAPLSLTSTSTPLYVENSGAASGTSAIIGLANSNIQGAGVLGTTWAGAPYNGVNKPSVYGYSSAGSGLGVLGVNSYGDGVGVMGAMGGTPPTAPAGMRIGVLGSSQGWAGSSIGVFGDGNSQGVVGATGGLPTGIPNGVGVYGHSVSGVRIGVAGTGLSMGVSATATGASGLGLAVQALGSGGRGADILGQAIGLSVGATSANGIGLQAGVSGTSAVALRTVNTAGTALEVSGTVRAWTDTKSDSATTFWIVTMSGVEAPAGKVTNTGVGVTPSSITVMGVPVTPNSVVMVSFFGIGNPGIGYSTSVNSGSFELRTSTNISYPTNSGFNYFILNK